MYKCKCGREFEKKSSLNSHARFCNAYKSENRKSKYKFGEKSYRCECGRIFDNPQGLNGHFSFCIIHRNENLNTPYKKRSGGGGWNKNKSYDELYGKEKAEDIKKKIGIKSRLNPTGRAKTKNLEIERRRKISISMRGNGNGATTFRRQKISYKEIIFKSRWEVNTAKFFDLNGMDWKYEDKVYNLSETTSYRPDFSLYRNGIFIKHIEVKGYWRKDNKEKFEKFRNMYSDINIEVWDKKKLLELNISIK